MVKLTMEHECMEGFRYQGERVFDPHVSVGELIAAQRRKRGVG